MGGATRLGRMLPMIGAFIQWSERHNAVGAVGYVVEENGCHTWTGSLDKNGYGKVGVKGETRMVMRMAHRVRYEREVGPIPNGMQLDHLCRNKSCCNPAHLEAVTQRENLLRGNTLIARAAARTHCQKGHELTAGNLVASRLRDGRRTCRICDNEKHRRLGRLRRGTT